MPSLRFRHIELFRTLMMTRSVTQAASELRTSQPTASRVLGELEREVGFRLFARRAGKLVPTPEAFAFQEEVERSFVGLAEIRRVAENIANFRADALRISAIPSVAFGLLPKAMPHFRSQFADVQIALNVLSFEEVVRDVATQQCELGFVAYPVERPGIASTPFLTTSAAVVLPRGHRLARRRVVSAKDLSGVPLISTGPKALSRKQIEEAFARAGAALNIVLETQTGAVACALVKEKAGIALLEPLSAMMILDRDIAVRPFTPHVPFVFRILTRTDRPQARVAEKFLEVTLAALRAMRGSDLIEGIDWRIHAMAATPAGG